MYLGQGIGNFQIFFNNICSVKRKVVDSRTVWSKSSSCWSSEITCIQILLASNLSHNTGGPTNKPWRPVIQKYDGSFNHCQSCYQLVPLEAKVSIQFGPFISQFVLKPKCLRNLSRWTIWQAKAKIGTMSLLSNHCNMQTRDDTAPNFFGLVRTLWKENGRLKEILIPKG